MKNKLLFKIIKFLRKLGIKPEDITLDLENEEAMSKLAQMVFSAILSLPDLEDEYYTIVSELYECSLEEAEDKDVFEIIPFLVKKLKGSANFSFGALTNTI